MLKQFFDFLITGVSVIILYFIYAVSAFITTFVVGVPIGLAIKFVIDAVDIMYNSWVR